MALIQDIRDIYHECIPYHQEQRRKRQDNWDNFFGQYNGLTRSKLFVPLTFSKVQGIVAKMLMGMYSYKDFFVTMPVTEDDVDSAEAMHKLLKKQTATADFFLNLSMWVTYVMIHGHGMVKTYWHRQQKAYMQKIPIYKDGEFTGKYKKKVIKDWAIEEPRITCCNLDNLVYHPQAPYLFPERGDFIIDHQPKPVSEILKMQESEEFDTQLSREELEASINYFSEEWLGDKSYGNYFSSNFHSKYQMKRDPVCLFTEYHTDKDEYYVINLKHKVKKKKREEWAERKPYVSLKDNYIPHRIEGLGEVEVLADTQEHLNTSRNIRIDNLNIIQNRMWVVDIMAEISQEHLAYSKPGKVIYSSAGTDGIKQLETQDISQSAYREEQVARSDMDEVTGTYPYVMGQSPQRSETASGIMQIIKQANPKFDLKAKIIGLVGVKRVLEQFADLNMDNLSVTQTIRQIGEDGKYFFDTVKPEEVPGRYDFNIVVTTDYPVAEVRREQLTNWYRYAMNRPTIDQAYLDYLMAKEFELPDGEIANLVKLPPNKNVAFQDAEDENQIMKWGGIVNVHEADNDMQHIEIHKEFYNRIFNRVEADRAEVFENHLLEHYEQLKFKRTLNPMAQGGIPPEVSGLLGAHEAGGEGAPSTMNLPVSGTEVPKGAGQIVGQTQ